MDFVKFLRTPFYIEHLWWLLKKLEILHSKLQNLSEKYKNIKSTYSIPQYLIISFYSKDIPTFNELVIKNTLVKS